MSRSYRIITLGCRVNQAESDDWAAALSAAGWQPTQDKAASDLCVVNTCAVTASASQQSRQTVRQIARRNPNARIVVTGCASQIAQQQFASISGVNQVLSNPLKEHLPALLGIAADSAALRLCPAMDNGRSRPLVKVQEGCNASCTYCIVPRARGPSRSQPLESILRRLGHLGQCGFQEAVLTGVHLGLYGQDLAEPLHLSHLLARIAAEAPLERLRLSSIEPGEISDELLTHIAGSGRFCHHLHIPLQSGDDTILERMGRPYRAAQYARLVYRVRAALPDAAIGADVLVGFPGESAQAFESTCELVQSVPLTYLHVFPYSPRPGTPAAGFAQRVASSTLAERCRILREIGERKRREFAARFIGRRLQVLIEGRQDIDTGWRIGLSQNYLPVLLDPLKMPDRGLHTVRIGGMGAAGRLLAES